MNASRNAILAGVKELAQSRLSASLVTVEGQSIGHGTANQSISRSNSSTEPSLSGNGQSPPDVAMGSVIIDDEYLIQILSDVISRYKLYALHAIVVSSSVLGNALGFLVRALSRHPLFASRLDIFVSRPSFGLLNLQSTFGCHRDVIDRHCCLHEVNLNEHVSLFNKLLLRPVASGGLVGGVCWCITSAKHNVITTNDG